LILLAFLLPVAFYLLILGSINRRAFPVVVSGTWDAIGLLFAASGFLLFGGPGILSSMNERWRLFWLLGQSTTTGAEGAWQFWIFLSVLYYVVVAVGAGVLLWGRRHVTLVYNVEPPLVERALAVVLDRLSASVNVVRSGALYFFNPPIFPVEAGPAPATAASGAAAGITTQLAPAAGPGPRSGGLSSDFPTPNPDLSRPVVLEIDSSPNLRNVTLYWDPADTAVRHEVDAELKRLLEDTPVPPAELGGWLTTIGLGLLGLCLLGCGALVFVRLH
jgi:hypothetical protein